MKHFFEKNKFYVYTSTLAITISVVHIFYKHSGNSYNGVLFPIIFFGTYPITFLLLKEKYFPYYYLFYDLLNVILLSLVKSYLFNNFTGILIAGIVICMKPRFQKIAVLLYLLVASSAFLITNEKLFMYLIHMLKSIWYFSFIIHYMNTNYSRKKLDLTEQEKNILQQLCEGKYQKEVIGFSENTVCRKIKNACKRNGVTKDELKLLFREGNYI